MNPNDEGNVVAIEDLDSIRGLKSPEHDFLSVIPSFRILATGPYRRMTNVQLTRLLGLNKSSDTISLWRIAGHVMVDLATVDHCTEIDIWNAVMEGWGTKGYRSTGLNAALESVRNNGGSRRDFVQTVKTQTAKIRDLQKVGEAQLLIKRLESLGHRGILTEAEKSRLGKIASS